MFRDHAAAERTGKGPPLRDPDARGDQGTAAVYASASLLRPYYRERDRARGWDDAATAASPAAVSDSPRRTPPGEYAMPFPPPPVVERPQRPPLRDEEGWAWTPGQAPAALRDQYYPTHRDFGDDGRRHYPNERWGSPASGFSGSTSSSNWPGLDRGFRGSMGEADDLYPVRGGVAPESNQDWTMAASHRYEGRPTGPWAYAGVMANDADAAVRTGKTRSVNQDELTHNTESKHETVVAPTTRNQQLKKDTIHRKRPYRPEQQDTQEYQYRQRLTRESESEAIARLSVGRAATIRMRQSQSSASPNQVASERMSVGSSDSPITPSDKAEAKTSRYLREIDRRNILARIESGEKQSELAKEFQVTRAAICNLKKHRDVILSRVHGNPFAKHPKKSKLKPGNAQQQQQRLAIAGSSAARKPGASGHAALRKNPLLLQVASRSALLHFQRLSDPQSAAREFRRVCRRLMTLVVEEALAWVETAAFKRKSVKSVASGSARGSETSSDSHESRDACAVMIEPEASLFPPIFKSLEPDAPTGVIHFGDFGSTSSSLSVAASMEVDVDLPPELASSHVYLFHAVVTLGRSVWIAQAVRALVERGAGEAFICLVTVAVAAEAIAELQSSFPLLKIVTAHIDHPRVDEFSLNQGECVIDQLATRVACDADEEGES